RLRVEHSVQRRFVAVEVGYEHFNFAFRVERAHLANRLGPVGGAAVGEIVAVDRSDHGMREIQVLDCFGDVPRLFRIEQSWLTFPNSAEATMTRADVAAEHKGRS